MEAPSRVLPPPAFSGRAVVWQPQQSARAVPGLSPELSGAGGVSLVLARLNHHIQQRQEVFVLPRASPPLQLLQGLGWCLSE